MSVTTTAAQTINTVLDQADPDLLSDALRQVKLGTLLTPLKETITNATVNAAIVLTKPALAVITCRVSDVSGGAGALGDRVVSDSSGTPSAPHATGVPAIATLSADGTTITFEGTVKAAVVTYIPRSYTDITGAFKRT